MQVRSHFSKLVQMSSIFTYNLLTAKRKKTKRLKDLQVSFISPFLGQTYVSTIQPNIYKNTFMFFTSYLDTHWNRRNPCTLHSLVFINLQEYTFKVNKRILSPSLPWLLVQTVCTLCLRIYIGLNRMAKYEIKSQ